MITLQLAPALSIAVVVFVGISPAIAQSGNEYKKTEANEPVGQPTRIDWTFPLAPRSLIQAPPNWLPNYQSDAQSYHLHVPDAYDPEKENGLLLFVSPADRPLSISEWQTACDEAGLILAIPNGAGNDCHPPVRMRIVLDVLDDVRRKYRIDPDRTYIAGFSGGGRVACRAAFALPEYFGGVISIGSTGELRNEMWLRDLVTHRLSVANLIGSEDFNFVEVTKFRGPLLDSTGIRHKIWVIEGLAHEIPQAPDLLAAVNWLDESIGQRREYAKKFPGSRVAAGNSPSRQEQAAVLFQEAETRIRNAADRFSGNMILKGIAMRWPDLEIGKTAAAMVNRDESWKDEEFQIIREYLLHRARGLDAYATQETHEQYADQIKVRLEAAVLCWQAIIKEGKDESAVKEATNRLIELEVLLDEAMAKERDQ